VSTFLVPYVKEAQSHLSRGELVSDQVKYNLLQREVEEELIPYCKKERLTVIAYSPHAQGLLTGKYNDQHRPNDEIRSTMMSYFTQENLRRVQPVLLKLEEIAMRRGKTPSQIALNWTLRDKTVYPIVGVKRPSQVEQSYGALGWRLTDEESIELAKTAEKIRIDSFENSKK
jgi:myo-inositol catabolism protein IolS